jgi:hypothetical protein
MRAGGDERLAAAAARSVFIGVLFMTKTKLFCFAAAAVIGGIVIVQRVEAAPYRPAKTNTQANESYTVVKIGDDYKAIHSTGIKDEKKRIDDENKKALNEWKDAIKSDPKAERPVPLFLRVIKPGFLTQKGADEYIAKLLEDEDAKGGGTSKKDKK